MDRNKSVIFKKYTLLFLVITIVALVISAAALSLKRDAVAVQGAPEKNTLKYYTSTDAASQESALSSSSSQTEEQYLVTVYNGKIGVFRGNETSPFLTADIDVYLLPSEDISILKKGIPAESFSQVKRILEDYE